MNRPTDMITGMVVAKRKGWETAYLRDDGWFMTDYWVQGNVTVPDPRDDTDAALELLHWVLNNIHADNGNPVQCADSICCRDTSWELMETIGLDDIERFEDELPISGQPFRYAVINLAAQVMEIKDEN